MISPIGDIKFPIGDTLQIGDWGFLSHDNRSRFQKTPTPNRVNITNWG